jgi:hypothetical protein
MARACAIAAAAMAGPAPRGTTFLFAAAGGTVPDLQPRAVATGGASRDRAR